MSEVEGQNAAVGAEKEPDAKAPAAKPRASRRTRWLARLIVFVVCLGIAEIAARLAGYKPWNPNEGRLETFIVVPGPTMYSRDDEIGHALAPGMHMITYAYNTCLATHLDTYRRLTRPYDMAPPAEGAKRVWFFGDSYTYGGSISDNDAYPYLVQSKHPELDVQNYAIPGESSIQTLWLLKKLVAQTDKKPAVVLMGYASFHDGRTLMARGNRKAWHPYRSKFPTFPAARLDDGKLVAELVPVDYNPLPFEQISGLMNLVAVYYNKADVVIHHGKEVSQAVITALDAYCKENQMKFVLLGIHNSARTKEVIQWASNQGILSADISVDESRPENVIYADGHPSPKATREFAAKLEPVLVTALGK